MLASVSIAHDEDSDSPDEELGEVELIRADAGRISLRRIHPAVGEVMVHLPRQGYVLRPAGHGGHTLATALEDPVGEEACR